MSIPAHGTQSLRAFPNDRRSNAPDFNGYADFAD
jgi:hypothetical protein